MAMGQTNEPHPEIKGKTKRIFKEGDKKMNVQSFFELAMLDESQEGDSALIKSMGYSNLKHAFYLSKQLDPCFDSRLGGCGDVDWSPTDPESLVGVINNYLWDERWSESLISRCREGIEILRGKIEEGIKHDPEDLFSDLEEGDFQDAIEELEKISRFLIANKNVADLWAIVESYIANHYPSEAVAE